MIRGVVNIHREAVVRLRVRGPVGTEFHLDTIVDSGFTSSLTLPASVVSALGLSPQSSGIATLGDGSTRPYDTYPAEVEWGGVWRSVLVAGVGDEALLGMGLLALHKLTIEVVPGGSVEILPLP